MNLHRIQEIKNTEIVHYCSEEDIIFSKFNRVQVKYMGFNCKIELPVGFIERVLGFFRLFRRVLRLDKCNVFTAGTFLVLVRKYKVYSYNLKTQELKETLTLKNCRNILHQSMATNRQGELFFGEYGNNSERKPVNVYKSSDYGQSWEVVYQFKAAEIKHIHGCYYDPYEDKIWTLTGDFENENIIMKSDSTFSKNEKIGDGSQKYRAVNIIFKEKSVHWIMDSPIERSYHYQMDRVSYKVTKRQGFPGPIWYLKELKDGYYLASSSVEIGPGQLDNYAHLFITKDLLTWTEVAKFRKDFLPMPYFKWGVIAFADGEQTSKNFPLFFEALKTVEGKSYLFKIND